MTRSGGHRQPELAERVALAAQMACWLSTSVPSQSNMTSFMAAAYSIAAAAVTNS